MRLTAFLSMRDKRHTEEDSFEDKGLQYELRLKERTVRMLLDLG